MTKLLGLALTTAALLAMNSAYAEEKSCCAGMEHGKMHCPQSHTKLNLSPDQKAKLSKLEAQCQKAGCTKQSMEKFMKSAQGILSKEQLATLKAECARMCSKETKA